MKRLSWVLGLAVFGCPFALAADPTLPPDAPPLAGGCCAPQAPGCCDNGCGCEHQGGIIGGVGIYWVQPFFQSNPSYTTTTTTTVGSKTSVVQSTVDVNQQMDVAPEIWLGYIGQDGLGARIRWWEFRQGSNQSVNVPAGTATTLTSLSGGSGTLVGAMNFAGGGQFSYADTTKLDLQVWDVEALKDVQVGAFDLLFSGGVRFAHLNETLNQYLYQPGFGEAGTEQGFSAGSFTGAGPTLALEARWPFRNSGLALYGKARGSVLFGSAHSTAFSNNTPSVLFGAPVSYTVLANPDRVMSVAEGEIGLELSRQMGNNRVFGQLGLVGQDWLGVGTASGASAGNDFGFFGVVFRLGINY